MPDLSQGLGNIIYGKEGGPLKTELRGNIMGRKSLAMQFSVQCASSLGLLDMVRNNVQSTETHV